MKKSCIAAGGATVFFACLFSIFIFGCAKKEPGLLLRVNPFPSEGNETRITCTEGKDDVYYLFLPTGADRTSLYLEYAGPELECDGLPMPNKTEVDCFVETGEHHLTRGEESYTLCVLQSEYLPAVFIDTERPLQWLHEDKSNKSSGRITTVYDGVVSKMGLKYVKGRGNSTWTVDDTVFHNDKRPYNIKLQNSERLLGMSEAKKYCLLANRFDDTLIKNTVAMELAQKMGVNGALEFRQVDLYINGDYRGNYLLTEAVEAGKGRVEINNTEELNKSVNSSTRLSEIPLQEERSENGNVVFRWRNLPREPEKEQWAFLLELDRKSILETEICGFYSENQFFLALKNPEDASEAQVKTAASIYQRAENALFSESGYNAEGQYYTELVNVDSVVRAYLLQELVVNLYASVENVYLSIPEHSETVVMGPVWDFDQTTCVRDNKIWCACSSLCGGVSWFSAAFRHKDFRDEIAETWRSFFDQITSDGLITLVDEIARRNSASAVMDRYRWEIASYSVEATETGYQRLCAQLSHALASRSQFMEAGFSDNAAFVWYVFENNQFCLHRDLLARGDNLVVPAVSEAEEVIVQDLPNFSYHDEDFLCWSTEPDGAGIRVFPGDEIILSENETTLYAVWRSENGHE